MYPIEKEVSGYGRGTGSCLEKAWPVVDEQCKNCAGDCESENHGPPVILGEVCRQELCFRQMHRRPYFLHKGIHLCFVLWRKQGHDGTREPEELQANRQGVTPRLEP